MSTKKPTAAELAAMGQFYRRVGEASGPDQLIEEVWSNQALMVLMHECGLTVRRAYEISEWMRPHPDVHRLLKGH